MANGKTLLLLGLLFTVVGPFGVITSILGAKMASLSGMADLTEFWVGTVGAGFLFLAGLAMLIRLWPKITIKE